MRELLNARIGLLLLISVALACSLLRPKESLTWYLTLEIDTAAPNREGAARQTVTVIEKRLDEFGVSNYKVQVQGSEPGRVIVSLPDVVDRERLKRMLTDPGRLEFVHVVSPPSPAPIQHYSIEQEALESLGGNVSADRRVLPYAEQNEAVPGTPVQTRWVVVEWPPIIDGSQIRNASAVQSDVGEFHSIEFSLGASGAERFGAWTGANIREYLGIALNGEVKSIAYIKSQITDRGEISGRFTKQSAEDLAGILRSGALPAPVKIVGEGAVKSP